LVDASQVCCPKSNQCLCPSGSCPFDNSCCSEAYPIMCMGSSSKYCCRKTDAGLSDVCCANNQCACPSGICPGPNGACCPSTAPNICGTSGTSTFCCPDGNDGRKDVCCNNKRVCAVDGHCPAGNSKPNSGNQGGITGRNGDDDGEIPVLSMPNYIPSFLVG
jgi:hypothetical protein